MKKSIVISATLLYLAACDSTGPGTGANVAVKFSTGGSSAVRANAMSAGDARIASDLTVTGTNGTLVIDDIRFIVEELELRSSDVNSTCSENENEHDDDLRVAADGKSGSSGDDNEDPGSCTTDRSIVVL